jgi:hypothetical protein
MCCQRTGPPFSGEKKPVPACRSRRRSVTAAETAGSARTRSTE